MGRTKRLLSALLSVILVLLVAPSQALAVGNHDAAAKAAGYVAAQAGTTTDVGAAADSLLALMAVSDVAQVPQAAQLLAVVGAGVSGYTAASPVGAAKLVLVAVGLGRDPRSFYGVDLVAAVKAGIKADGSVGEYPGPFSSGLALLALTRAQEPVPQPAAQYLVRAANPDGGFGYAAGRPSDADSTGLAILGLLTQSDSISATNAVARAVAWATAQQQPDGSWKSESNPVNSTAILGTALQAAGQPQAKAVAYIVGQQLADGSLPDQSRPNLLATQQATLLLADTSYLTVSSAAFAAALAPTTPSAPATTSAGTATSAATAPASTGASAAPTASTPDEPGTAASDTQGIGALGVVLLVLLLLLLAGAAYMLYGRRPAAPPSTDDTETPAGDDSGDDSANQSPTT